MKRSYRDALTGDRNEFIGLPVMSGGAGGASGAPEPGRDETRKSFDKKIRSSDEEVKSPLTRIKSSNRSTDHPHDTHDTVGMGTTDMGDAFDRTASIAQSSR